MNKTAIKNFSIWARNKLIADICYRAGLMGISDAGIAEALPQSTQETQFFDIGTKVPHSITGKAVGQRARLADAIRRKAKESDYATAYKYVLEEVAYTWFNRLIAIRFMEVNDYLPSHIRVLSSDTGKLEPDLVTTPFDAELDFTDAEREEIVRLQQDNNVDALFQILFIKQCNALHAILPGLFEPDNDYTGYTELLLNLSVVDQDGVVYHLLNDIPEKDFNVSELDENGKPTGQVEIVGWLYQYYNTEPKNEAFAKKGKITKDEIPAVTQLFTPDWIVRYMVENSLGRLWVEGHPNDDLKAGWQYYLEEAEQEPEVASQLAEIRKGYADLTPEDIRVIDPCMGSGHILVYAFDVLMQIYESAGYSRRDAASKILENNLYGLDIDDRAYQLAYFSVMMKARQYDRRALTRGTKVHVFSIQESNGVNPDYLKLFGDLQPTAKRLLDNMRDAKEYGSIIRIELTQEELATLREAMESIKAREYDNFFDSARQDGLIAGFEPLLDVAEVLARQYEVVVTNPPYMSNSSMGAKLSNYVRECYPNSKADLFAIFIERCGIMVKTQFYQAMITQHAWMFLSSFEFIRQFALNKCIVNMAHLGARAFSEISGEVVQTTSFVICASHIPNYNAIYCNLTEGVSEQEKAGLFLLGRNRFTSKTDCFSKIPGSPVAYWLNNSALSAFEIGSPLSQFADLKQGMSTANNDLFLRLWFEVCNNKVSYSSKSREDALSSNKKWFPQTKGGGVRKWYGNNDYLVNWQNDGYAIRNYPGCALRNVGYYFREGLTWSTLAAGPISFRYTPEGFTMNTKGSICYLHDLSKLCYFLALLNSKVSMLFLSLLAPTLDYSQGPVGKIPVIENYDNEKDINAIVQSCIKISKEDWNNFESSWDFQRHPLTPVIHPVDDKIELAFDYWAKVCEMRFQKLKCNEEELNRIFIDIYGLQNELTPEVEDKDVTVRRADLTRDIKSLLSYAVGCMFGRYSLDVPGLAYAGSEWDRSKYTTFQPVADNIIPLTDEEYLPDDIITRLCEWLKDVFGESTLEANLDFIAKALGGKGKTSRAIIRNYFLTGFFDDHCQTYSVTGSGKRPIYWLFDSGKQNGFKALIYLHRYNEDTIGNLRIDYLHRLQRIYESEIERMQDTIDNSKNTHEVATATKRREKLQKQLKECREYDEKIGHLALSRIVLDLDDGVKVNYRKVQTARDGKFYEVLAGSKQIMAKEK